jgi:hypothetical protein
VAKAVNEAEEERAARTEVTADWVVQRLKLEAMREDEQASHSARVSALTQLGKHLGMFEDRMKLVGKDDETPQEERLAQFRERYGGDVIEGNAGGDAAISAGKDGSTKPAYPALAEHTADTVPGAGKP